MLQIVPLPVQLMLVAPSPKYSTTAPVPPFTVRIPATFKITSFGAVHPLNFPVSFTPINFGNFNSQGNPAITSHAFPARLHLPYANLFRSSFRPGRRSFLTQPGE